MKMALLYNDTCPQDYEPPGFHADNGPKSLIASNKGAKIGSMNTGFHGYRLSSTICYQYFLTSLIEFLSASFSETRRIVRLFDSARSVLEFVCTALLCLRKLTEVEHKSTA
jgi:hypothetical protein